MNIESEQAMLEVGRDFASKIAVPFVIELVGDVGVGKTTFVQGLAEGLGVKESVTSPSFTISKVYALPKGGNLIHYDFYRLSEPGLMMDDLAEKIEAGNNVVVIEWGDSVAELLPSEHVVIKFEYDDAGGRHLDML